MNKYVFYIIIYFIVSATQNKIQNNTNKKIYFTKLFGGKPVDYNETYHVATFYTLSKFTNQHCAGTVISSKHILSAGHCFTSYYKKSEYQNLILILFNNEKENIYRKIEKIHFFKKINDDNILIENTATLDLRNDLAVIKFYPKLNDNLSKRMIKELSTVTPNDNDICNVYSYDNFKPIKADLKIYSWDFCAQLYNLTLKPLGRLCAGPRDSNNKADVCRGESGSGLIINDTVIGIVSGGVICTKGLPSVYTNVAHFHDWIEEKMNLTTQNSPSKLLMFMITIFKFMGIL